ncbi:hypothetical protein FGO68_gene16837 [Halteria grandinella]|uniref:TLDc domain-containing protein n=1 Tax=Halteria grandinella TaxID=5974 RepID=A0A8J8NK25_HALGN|nr:hypothetical protein FGO68_gene16837 [Halteria grandinella]
MLVKCVMIIQMNKAHIAILFLITQFTLASAVPDIGNCSQAFFFAEEHDPGTKFTCSNQTAYYIWECKVIEVMFPICSKDEKCKSFNCQRSARGDFYKSNMNITVNDSSWLLEQIKVPYLKLKPVLLFQASRDGWYISDYHSKVNGYKNIYVFIKYKQTQRRAAGFTSLNQGLYYFTASDYQSYVLSIDKRIVATGSKNYRKLLVSSNYGPFFKDVEGQAVMTADYGSRIDKGYANCGLSKYYMPFEDNQLCSLSGLQNGYYEIDELEVWHIL